MPTFSSEAPDDPRGHALQLVRTPTGRALVAIVTSDQMLGAPTHYWGGRTVPHEEEECKPCLEGQPWRWHAWLGAYDPKGDRHFLFECTARVSDIFKAYRQTHGTLRGCKFRAQRRTMAANARVYLECQPCDLRSIRLPEEPDIVKCMSIIWNIREPEIDVSGVLKSVPRVVVNKSGNGELKHPEGELFEQHDEAGPIHSTVSRIQRNR